MNNAFLEAAIAAIEAQQPKERTDVWMAGEQLKDMLRDEPRYAELIVQDLGNKELSLAKCAGQIKAYADKHRTGSFACVIPSEAERIIREFYGLPERGTSSVGGADTFPSRGRQGNVVDLMELI